MIRHLFCFVLLFIGLSAHAQVNSPKYSIGPKVGFNVYKSRFEFKEDESLYDQKIKVGYQVGGMLDLPLKKSIFHFHMELYYSRKGKKTDIVDVGLTNNATYNYIEAPVLLRLSILGGKSPAGNYKWHVDLGPSISYWLGGRGELYGDGPKAPYKIKFGEQPTSGSSFDKMYISHANRVQWGVVIGAGIDYPVVKHQFVYIDIRAGLGSSNLAESNGVASIPVLGFSESLNVRYLEFSISAAYTFEIDWIQTKKGKSTVDPKKPLNSHRR